MRSVYEIIAGIEQRGEMAALCIITETRGSTPLKAGAKMIVWQDKKIFGTIGGGNLEHKVINDALTVMQNNTAQLFEHQLVRDHQMCCGGTVFIFIETIKKRNKLIVFGAGHVGKEVVKFARSLNFQISLVDERVEMFSGLQLEDVKVFHMHHRQFLSQAEIDENTYVVICTHLHQYDREILARCIKRPLAYLGMIGSKRKIAITKKAFLSQGLATEQELSSVDMPMGFDIGGNTPAEIGISIVAKLVAVMNGRQSQNKDDAGKIKFTYAEPDSDNNRSR
ncbi:MAG: XdhC family protein [Sphingobacteriales bacterium]|nr:XdhC family protein [Sphingobacteriales bacterium]